MAERDKVAEFSISATVILEGGEERARNAKLYAYAFAGGDLVAKGTVEGGKIELTGKAPVEGNIELHVSPSDKPEDARRSMSHTRTLSGEDFKVTSGKRSASLELRIRPDEWIAWFPFRFCVDGHIRKLRRDGTLCPVSFVKVEVFDVDREWCWWQWLRPLLPKLPLLPDRYVVRIPDLIKPKPPLPDPPPFRGMLRDLSQPLTPGAIRGFNPQPDPPGTIAMAPAVAMREVGVDPQADAAVPLMASSSGDFDPQPDPPGANVLPGMMKELGRAKIFKPCETFRSRRGSRPG